MSEERCSFCGKDRQHVHLLITGMGSSICDWCVAMCADVIADEIKRQNQGAKRREEPAAKPEGEAPHA